jgi:hypothetical protein
MPDLRRVLWLVTGKGAAPPLMGQQRLYHRGGHLRAAVTPRANAWAVVTTTRAEDEAGVVMTALVVAAMAAVLAARGRLTDKAAGFRAENAMLCHACAHKTRR